MKILQIHNAYIFRGGEDTVVEQERNLLVENGHEVFQLKKKNKEEIINLIDKLKVAKNLSYSKAAKNIVYNEIKKINPEIAHIHNTFPLWSASVFDACIENNIPIVLTLHNYRTICANGLFFRKKKVCEKCLNRSPYHSVLYGCYQNSRIKSLPVAKMIDNNQKNNIWGKKINRFIVLTNFAKNKFIQANFPKNKIRVKPNFISTKIFPDTTNDILKKNCLYVGRLSQEKGIKTLLKAWESISFPLKIFGDGPLYNQLNKNQPNINFLGEHSRDKIIKEMKLAKFLIFPSECYEGFSMTMLESFSLGLPVLASNIGSMREIIEDNYNGILFKTGDFIDLKKKINWLLANPDECRRLAQNALKDYSIKYSKEENYKILIKIYKEVINDYIAR